MTPRCDAPVSDADLLDYWIQAMPEMDAGQIEEHLFSCGECTARLDAMASLGAGLASLARLGRVSGIVSRALLNRLQRDGVHVRMYSASPGERSRARRSRETICWSFPCVSTLRDRKW